MNWPTDLRESALAATVAALTLAAPQAQAADAVAPGAVVYVDGGVAQSLTGAPGNPEAGKAIISTAALGNCVACHQISALPEVDFQGNVGPSLDGVADRYDEAHLRGLVANAKQTFPDTVMPAFYKTEGFSRPGEGYTGKAPTGELSPVLDAEQIENVVAYLLTLR